MGRWGRGWGGGGAKRGGSQRGGGVLQLIQQYHCDIVTIDLCFFFILILFLTPSIRAPAVDEISFCSIRLSVEAYFLIAAKLCGKRTLCRARVIERLSLADAST